MAFISKRNIRREKEIATATKNRQEIVTAQLSRRDLMKMGLLTSAGMLIPKQGLSARWADPRAIVPLYNPQSPPTTPFIEPLPIPPVKQPVTSLSPVPTASPNTSANEGRTRTHQAFTLLPPQKLYQVHQRAVQKSVSPNLPLQTLWGFDGEVPGPTYIAKYGEPILVRNVNNLPSSNGGFGIASVSTHLHNGHNPSESDGFPCDYFGQGKFYDHHYPNVLAGFTEPQYAATKGDPRESLSTLWYHDHRVDFTAQNVYKGLAGFYLLFNDKDTGDETTGFRLPSGQFDVPMIFTDRVFDQDTGALFFDLFNLDGILGDKFLVNGKIQPFFKVHPRKYRFRWLDGGPSRFYQFFLTDTQNLNAHNMFWQISNDGNLLPKPIQVESVLLSVAERADVIIDFSQFAGRSIYLENRAEQDDGRGPTGDVLPPGQGNYLLRFDVELPNVPDNSQNPATITKFYDLPPVNPAQAQITRTFRFERQNGQWAINQQFFNCNTVRFNVKQNTSEVWVLQNNSGGWQHPIHIHFEEFQILSRNGVAPGLNSVERSRKDVARLGFNEEIRVFFRFRDFLNRYPMHCHNTLHEDHAMMLRFDIDTVGDNKTNP
jgi:FtsP/CotA-like multicopper oxidase with cupredoxin domain